MKNNTVSTAIIILVVLLFPRVGSPQGVVTYVSNLGQSSTGSVSVGANAWYAADFISGTNTGGYLLDSIQLQLTDSSGSPNGFTVMIYMGIEEHGGIFPGSILGTLSGSANPTAGGVYTYSPSSGLTLLPNQEYFVVLTADTPVSNGAYGWSVTSTGSPGYNSYHWGGEVLFAESSNGSSWAYTSGTFGQYSLDATAAPEPGVTGIIFAGCLLFGLRKLVANPKPQVPG